MDEIDIQTNTGSYSVMTKELFSSNNNSLSKLLSFRLNNIESCNSIYLN
ncbi:MAG: hypothetical protein ACPHY8_03650 [Patescibacteria group bacterium]